MKLPTASAIALLASAKPPAEPGWATAEAVGHSGKGEKKSEVRSKQLKRYVIPVQTGIQYVLI